MNEQAVQRQSIEAALRLALEREEFVVYYQPDVDLASGALLGVEALLRWQHPQQGLLAPERFMNVAEDSGLIVPIGTWVLREASRQMQAWLAAGFEVGHVAVNISAVELRAKHFLKSVRAAVEDAGLDPQRLEFEFTEGVLMRDAELSGSRLRALKAMGFHLSIDHFGTGYSSLGYLRRFPIDTLKIDQSFVHELAANSGDASIAGAIIALGKSLRYRVVADGVETQDQRAVLQARGCAEGQGFLFGRPLAADAWTRH
jgi:EAL domain-containing protein (putative c-di-GMP-specific phosphodiesterase class I)